MKNDYKYSKLKALLSILLVSNDCLEEGFQMQEIEFQKILYTFTVFK